MAREKLNAGISQETAEKLNKIAQENPGGNLNENPSNAINEKTYVPRNMRNMRPRYKNPNNIEEALKIYPEHIVKLVNLVKSNSDIRRYTSLGILNYLFQKGIIEEAKGYVTFNWTKFRVVNRGLSVEYRYTEAFFLNCLIASFTSFANAAQKIIGVFCSNEFEEAFKEDKAVMDAAIEAAENADEASEKEAE